MGADKTKMRLSAMFGRVAQRNEQVLLLLLAGNIYKKPKFGWPNEVDWNLLIRLAFDNKICYHIVNNLLEYEPIKMRQSEINEMVKIRNERVRKLMELQRTLRELENLLGDEGYVLLNTYRFHRYVTHDVDIVVSDIKRVSGQLESAGFRLLEELLPGIHYAKEGCLIVDIFETVGWGSIEVMDNDLVWQGTRDSTLEGVSVRLPSVEGDILSIIAHTNFQFYQLTLSDMLYIYRLAPLADWSLIVKEARKYKWLRALCETVSILNGFHRLFYHEPSEIENYIGDIAKVHMRLPFIPSLGHVARALIDKGVPNLTKLISYPADRLVGVSYGLQKAYCDIVLGRLGRPWIRHGPVSYAG